MGLPAGSSVQPRRTCSPRRPRVTRGDVARMTRALEQYPPGLRHRLSAFARSSPRHTDLLLSFPAAAVAIATEFGPAHHRGEAMWQVRAGAPLSAVSEALDLPLWMRRLPASCFDGALPSEASCAVSSDKHESDFGRRVVTGLPEHPDRRPLWLRSVILARAFGDSDIAAWVGRESARHSEPTPIEALQLIILFAWAARRGDGFLSEAIDSAWTPQMSWVRAVRETARWYRKLIWLCQMVDDPEAEARAADWRRAQRVGRFEIRPILTAPEVRREALVMRNCLRQYEAEVLEGRALLFAIRADGRSIASLELGPSMVNPSQLSVVQLKGVGNSAPPRGVRFAVSKWLGERPAYPWRLLYEHAVDAVDPALWRRSWRRYLLANPGAGAEAFVPFRARAGLRGLQALDSLLANAGEDGV